MKNYRMSKGTTEHFTSLESLRNAYGLKPVTKRTNDKVKLKKQQESFASKHKCKACGNPMTYLNNGNIMTCTNPDCKGIEKTRLDKDGNETKYYLPSYDILNDMGAEIAANIFS